MEISDISEESMRYLIDEGIAKELYRLVGGRILDLKTQTKKQKLIEIELLQEKIYYEAGKRVINALLDSKEISINTFKRIFKNNNEKEYREVSKAVFAYHPSSNTVSFQS
ncbi:hypothetical protein RclHR1_02110010 [Rhizophagus clarus]|uniref:Uncharacterized protein n=1 Tax=Rhizophagus clarus TaxID=94130 RepID=A0A2Z6R818_9GLOM|nr:hypothetical protein RclHR1_02110010 [Rhizophagus clarus]